MVNTTAMEQMTKYYWGMVGARAAAGATTATSSLRSSWPPPGHGGGGEPSWEELAFARDAAGHLGGCVWPPRSYTCSFCRREFRSAQALGGHMNVHRRDRARLRLCASPDHDIVQVQDTPPQIQPIATPPVDHHHQDQQEAPVFRAKAVLLSTSPKSTWDHQRNYSKEEAVISASPSSLSTIIKENKKKVVISIPAAARRKEVLQSYEEEDIMAATRKRRRVDQPQEVVLPFFLPIPAPSCERIHEHDAKVPKVITAPSSSSALHLAGRQELDLELRLGSPKVA